MSPINIISIQTLIKKSMTVIKLGLGGIILLAALLLWFSPACSAIITESFINNNYNHNLWDLQNYGTGVTSQITNNRLEVTVAGVGNTNFRGYGFTLTGDFDMKADFTLINWPTNCSTQVYMGTNANSQSHFQIARANGNGQEQYFSNILSNYQRYAVTGPTLGGKLRMRRTGNKMEGFYWDGANWQPIGSATDASLGGAVGVMLGISPYGNSYSGTPSKAAFSNIQIYYPTGGKGGFVPAIMMLMDN